MDIKFSFIVTFIAGLSTLVGTLPIFLKIKDINKLIVISLSFASGVMFYISTFDLLFESLKLFNKKHDIIISLFLFILLFILGMLITKLINNSIKNEDNLYKLGIISMIAIILHNIPEGILTFVASNVNKKLGLSLGIAIAMHNIPEGISIAIPIFYGTRNKAKAICYTFISALSEPLGALIGFIFLKNIMNYTLLGILFSLVCGIMIYISIFELIKEAKKYNEDKLVNIFFIIGMIFMFITLKI